MFEKSLETRKFSNPDSNTFVFYTGCWVEKQIYHVVAFFKKKMAKNMIFFRILNCSSFFWYSQALLNPARHVIKQTTLTFE